MATVLDITRTFKRRLLTREEDAATEITRAYAVAYQAIQRELDELLRKMMTASATGETISRAWLNKAGRLEWLLGQAATEIKAFSRHADLEVLNGQKAAVDLALRQAEQTIGAGMKRSRAVVGAEFNQLPAASVEALVGTFTSPSPVKRLFDSMGPAAAESIQHHLIEGVALGKNPRVIARLIKDDLGGNLNRALTISRTEMLTANRTATLEAYRENEDVLDGWIRIETLSPETCPVCLVEHGTVYRLESEFYRHPNCRGTLAPMVKGAPVQTMSGVAWFAGQSESVQQDVLGPSKFEAYRRGDLRLPDLVQKVDDPIWGPGISEKSLADALAEPLRRAA